MEGKSKKNQQQTKAFFLRFKYVFHFLGHQDLFTLNDQPIAPH